MKVTMSRSQWEKIGNATGWAREAMARPSGKKAPPDPDDPFSMSQKDRDDLAKRMMEHLNRDQNREELKGIINVTNGDWNEFVNGSFAVARKAAPAILKYLDLLVQRSRAPGRGWQARDNINALREKLITPGFRDELADAVGRAAIKAVAETISSDYGHFRGE